MAFQYLTNVPLEQAKKEYMDLLARNGLSAKAETIPVQQSCDRITAEAVYAKISAPHYNASAMDGIALNAKITFGASETTPVVLLPEDFTEVDTGDQIPEDCDAVVMIEDVIMNTDGSVKLFEAAKPWQNIRQIGEDICAGEMILSSQMRITPAAIGSLIAGGVLAVNVYKKPVVGIIPTGDEIVAPCAHPKPGDILEFNSSIFSAMLNNWGACAVTFPIVKDNFSAIRQSLSEALCACDIVILNAGSSAGREDYSAQAIKEIGDVLYHGIAIKPGKPAILGYQGAKPILGVPGYPVSGIIVMEQILKPIIASLCHADQEKEAYEEAVLTRRIVSGFKYQEFIRVRMGYVNEKMIAVPLNRGSGVVSSFMKADGILEVPQSTEGYEAGDTVKIRLLRDKEVLMHTLFSVGSHDPLLDELAEILHRTDREIFMSSSHVGSMGGIMALKKGEAHIAGCHLLDEKDGSYNISAIKKYFPDGGIRIIECVGRTQGLMVQKGNPKHITGIEDIAREGIKYVNRQKGSGTRILLDYLCDQKHIQKENVYGYDREEFTHTSVAAQIDSGTADAGMGIYSAAKMYGLDFLPVCTEEYDLLIPDTAWELPMVQKLIEVLKSEEFHEKLIALGGYEISQPGRCKYE